MSKGESQLPLDALQRWMQAVIVHPGGAAEGMRSGEARAELDLAPSEVGRVVTRSRALTAIERLEIYNRAYYSRLVECLREEYTVLATALGEELFDGFAVGYLQAYPSRSYTLGHLGGCFPEYLAETRPKASTADEPDEEWPEFLIDLARLERSVNTVFDGPGVEGRALLSPDRLAAIPPELWSEARLECVPCLQLLALSYPVSEYFTAVRRKKPAPDIPDRVPSFVAITRRDYRVYRYPLAEAQYKALEALMTGQTIRKAVEQAAGASAMSDEQFVDALRGWFFQWTADGFFQDASV
jgi:hypothetical protein